MKNARAIAAAARGDQPPHDEAASSSSAGSKQPASSSSSAGSKRSASRSGAGSKRPKQAMLFPVGTQVTTKEGQTGKVIDLKKAWIRVKLFDGKVRSFHGQDLDAPRD